MAEKIVEGVFWKSVYGAALEPELSPVEKQLRDLFIKEFMHDRNPKLAAMRCGFHSAYAEQYAGQFLGESYVRIRMAELERNEPDDLQEQETTDKRMVLAVLRQAMHVGPYPSRVAASAKMAAIYGMDAPAKSEQTILHRGGVMAVPSMASIDDWEKAAEASQSKLISDTRE